MIFCLKIVSCGHINDLNLVMAKWLKDIWHLYYDGFRGMTLGRTLWLIILVKLFVIFVILKLFFFPDYIGEHAAEGHEADFVSSQIIPPSP